MSRMLAIRANRRFALREPVQLAPEGGTGPFQGLLIELSRITCRISNLGQLALAAGDDVTLSAQPCEQLRGTVRWAGSGCASIQLETPLSSPDLLRILEESRGPNVVRQLAG